MSNFLDELKPSVRYRAWSSFTTYAYDIWFYRKQYERARNILVLYNITNKRDHTLRKGFRYYYYYYFSLMRKKSI